MAVRNFYIPPSVRNVSTKKWIDRYRLYDNIYDGYFFNHLSHNTVVMGHIGLPEEVANEKMERWDRMYRTMHNIRPCRSIEPNMPVITSENWMQHFGSTRVQYNYNYPAYLAYFDDQIQSEGTLETLQSHFPRVVDGMAACALHPIIHVGFGLEADHGGMVAEGLAAMCSMRHTIGSGTAQWSDAADGAPGILASSLAYLQGAEDANLHAIAVQAASTPLYKALQIGAFQRILLTFEDEALPLGQSLDACPPVGLPALSTPLTTAVEEATRLISAAYLASDCEFFVLHGLTSLHATLAIIGHLQDAGQQREALVHWWRTVMAVLVCLNIPGLREGIVPLLDHYDAGGVAQGEGDDEGEGFWPRALELSVSCEDEHVGKVRVIYVELHACICVLWCVVMCVMLHLPISQAVYALWRWSTWTHVHSPGSRRLFRAAAQNQLRDNEMGGPHHNIWFKRILAG